jgi:GNAT superfamily N-acetyltransferase
MKRTFPPYELVDPIAVTSADDKTRRLERLYHLTQTHAWDGKATLAALVDKHGPPGRGMDPEMRFALLNVLSVLLWGELAAWSISADLALEIDDVDAKMAATGQVFDEARHFTVMRDYVLMLAEGDGHPMPIPRLGGMARKLLMDVLNAKALAKKLLGMQLLFETNAVVIFRRLAEAEVCPILAEILPYFERDESRHVGLGVLYLPRLVEKMTRAEAASTASFQMRCIAMLIAGGLVLRPHFERLGLDQRLMATRVTMMQDDIVRQMVAAHGSGIARAILNPRASFIGPKILDLIHPPEGLGTRPSIHRAVHRGVTRAVVAVDRAFSN